MASNTLLTPIAIAKIGLIGLYNNLVMGNLVHRDYSNEYQKIGSTVIVRKPPTYYSTAVSDTVSVNNITEGSVAVVLNSHLDITVEITSQQLTLNVVDFSKLVTMPVMEAHAQAIDTLLTALYADVGGHQAVSATPAVSDIAGLRAVMSVQKAPLRERRLVFHPITEADYVSLASFLNAEKRGDTQVIKEASMGRVLGFDCYMDQNIATHTANESDLACALKGAWAAAATAGTIDACAAGGTYEAGACFKVTGYDEWFTLTAASTASQATAVLAFSPAVKGTLADDAVVTFQDTHRANLGFHKNAFALVSRPLAPPLGGAAASALSYKGVSARVVYDYVMMTKKNLCSFDMLVGVKTLEGQLAARLADAR